MTGLGTTDATRAMVGARIATLSHGQRQIGQHALDHSALEGGEVPQ